MEPDEIEKLELPGPHFQGSVSNVRKHFPRVEKPYAASPGSHSSQTGLTRKRTRELGMLDTTPQQSKRKSPRKAFPDNVEFIHIEEDDPDPVATIEQQYQTICRTRPKSNDASAATIDLTANDYLTDNQCDQLLRKMSLQEDKEKAAALDIREPIPSYTNNKPRFKCTPGKCVELFDGDFLRIKSALQDGHGKVFVRGDHLVRQNYRGLTMSKRRNEVVLVRRVVESTAGTNSALHEVSVEHVLKNRHIIFTNQNFPLLSGRDDDASFQDPTQQVTFGPLFCRWIDTTVVDERRRSVEHIIQRLDFRDADDDTRSVDGDRTRKTRIATNEARFQWRGIPTELGGMHVSGRRTGHLDGKIEVEQVRSYTFADAFCGAGGTSRGAIDAGLHLRWGFDNNLEAITSYRHNFQRHGADCRHQSVDEFIRLVIALNDVSPFRVDVLHISPPCQPFSPAHTIPSPERDEMNQAALPSVWQLVEKLKPRIVTMEETEGLFTRHKEWFSLLINTFTSLGYSVRWKIVQCHSFGVPQTRRRLVIIAAGLVCPSHLRGCPY